MTSHLRHLRNVLPLVPRALLRCEITVGIHSKNGDRAVRVCAAALTREVTKSLLVTSVGHTGRPFCFLSGASVLRSDTSRALAHAQTQTGIRLFCRYFFFRLSYFIVHAFVLPSLTSLSHRLVCSDLACQVEKQSSVP